METASLAIDHLLLKLGSLNRALHIAVERQRRAAERLVRPGLAPLCVTDEHVAALLADVDALTNNTNASHSGAAPAMNERELEIEKELRVNAEAHGMRLPLDVLTGSFGLLSYEEMALLVCAAPEVERSYGRIYGYVLDDLNRQHPCVELICMLAGESTRQQLALRRALGRFGRLRRWGVLQPLAEAAIEAKQELRLAPALLDFVLGAPCDPTSHFRDPAEVIIPANVELPPEIARETLERLVTSISERRVSLVGIWGPRHCAKEELLWSVAAGLNRPLRLLSAMGTRINGDGSQEVSQAIQIASALEAILWIDTDNLMQPEREGTREALTEALASTTVPVFLTGTHPWRPVHLLESRAYTEFELTSPSFRSRKRMWSSTLPDVHETEISKLAARFRMSGAEVRAAVQLARTSANMKSNGHRAELVSELEAACATVTRKRSDHFATVVQPKRKSEDLVLPDDIHKQVIEIAQFFRASALVDEDWGFGRMSPGGGIKSLFTGEPGTGKTLAAEVIAGIIGLPLLKVDLARVVSKWVGETEKNLDTVFREAEESHSVLFFDEADSLFGKRGEVQHGTDRYANLEIGFLLQRLEDYFGLVILASNLKDQIDNAFTRRFHVIVHFPLPRPAERKRIWKLAFPPNAPTEGMLDLDLLMQLDMTGAAIVSAARTAALLAANENSLTISMAHVVNGIARQFRREARILTPTMLGCYASLLNGKP